MSDTIIEVREDNVKVVEVVFGNGGSSSYTHPTGDGNLHVPATSTTNDGKVLTAGATAGAISAAGAQVNAVDSVAGKTGVVTLVKADVGLGSVDNTSDLSKPISTAVQTALDLKLDDTQLNAANGIAPLGADSKVPTANLPDSIVGAMVYSGVWNASTNTPNLTTVLGQGLYYKVSVAGSTSLSGITDWNVGDWVVSNGTTWDKIDNTETVSSVAGKTGAVTLVKGDVGLGSVDNTSDADKPVSTLQQTALDGKVDDAQVLTNVPSGALFTDTVYTHPVTDGNLHVPATSTTNNGKVLTAGATAGALTWETPSGGGTSWTMSFLQTGELAAGDIWMADASGGAVSRNLPTNPADDDEVIVKDDTLSADTNTITIGANGKNIQGLGEDLIVGVIGASVRLKYNTANGWRIV